MAICGLPPERSFAFAGNRLAAALRALTYTWTAFDLVSVVTWTLNPTRTGTRLRMEQSGFRSDQRQAYQGAKGGWQHFFANLEQVLGRTN